MHVGVQRGNQYVVHVVHAKQDLLCDTFKGLTTGESLCDCV